MNDFFNGREPYRTDRSRCYCPSGSRIVNKMHPVSNNQGVRYLEKVGETNLYDYIQSFREEVDLKKIIERCMLTGDGSALNKVQGSYADLTGLPMDLRSAHDILAKARVSYETLDPKIKIHYRTFEDYLEVFASEENFRTFADLIKPVNTIETTTEGGVSGES